MRLIWVLGLCFLLPLTAQAKCRQALALGLDVSGSVDAFEYRLQIDGLAGALLRPEVQQAFMTFPQAPVRLFVYEWAIVRTGIGREFDCKFYIAEAMS